MMPDALTIHSGVDSRSGSCSPAAMRSAFLALSRRTNSLKAAHSSGFSRTVSGCHTPHPVIEVLVVVRAMTRTLPEPFHDGNRGHGYLRSDQCGIRSRLFRYFGFDLAQRTSQKCR